MSAGREPRFRRIEDLNDRVGFYSRTGGYGPQLVGRMDPPPAIITTSGAQPREPSPPRLRPFVLRCPNCIAPIESGVTHCGYCKVPYVWEPALPLTRDDQAYRYEPSSTSPPSSSPSAHDFVRGIGPCEVHANAVQVFSLAFQEVVRPHKLWVNVNCADAFAISDVRIGTNSVHVGSDTIPARACADGEGLDLFSGETLVPGVRLQIHVVNLTRGNTNFHGLVRGTRIDRGALKT